MVMIFQVQEAREQLLKKGRVFTFRAKNRHKLGRDWATDHRGGRKIANINVKLVAKVTCPEMLWPYAYASGFESLDAWVAKITEKYREVNGNVYEVTLLEVNNHEHK